MDMVFRHIRENVVYRSNQVKKENQATYEKGRIRIHGRK